MIRWRIAILGFVLTIVLVPVWWLYTYLRYIRQRRQWFLENGNRKLKEHDAARTNQD